LIVGVVGGGQEVGTDVGGDAGEGGIAETAGVGFEVAGGGSGGDVGCVEGKGERGGQIADVVEIGVGVGTEVVMDVSDVEIEEPVGHPSQRGQGAKEGDGVGSATDSDEDAIAGFDATGGAQCVCNGFDEPCAAEHDGSIGGHACHHTGPPE
jgi:hypothetical protein